LEGVMHILCLFEPAAKSADFFFLALKFYFKINIKQVVVSVQENAFCTSFLKD